VRWHLTSFSGASRYHGLAQVPKPEIALVRIDTRIVGALRGGKHVVALTGAGVSAESGIPTFRDKQTGLWEKFDASELATPSAFQRDPALVWGRYEWRRSLVLTARPNPAHQALAAIAKFVPRFTLITQNVDDLHERAGSEETLHLHGSLSRPYCEGCRQPYVHPPGIPEFPVGGARLEPPRCTVCASMIRPGVVWFGESLPEMPWRAACEAAKQSDVFFCCGTSSRVQPAASLTDMAIAAGAITIQINPGATDDDKAVTVAIQELAGVVLPRIVADTWSTV
jgi:NAD-dependent deacetylase